MSTREKKEEEKKMLWYYIQHNILQRTQQDMHLSTKGGSSFDVAHVFSNVPLPCDAFTTYTKNKGRR